MDIEDIGGEKIRTLTWQSFFRFDQMIFPVLAKLLFIVLCALAVVIAGIVVLSGAVMLFSNFSGGVIMVFGGFVQGILSLLFLRLWFEAILVIFSINDRLGDIRDSVKK